MGRKPNPAREENLSKRVNFRVKPAFTDRLEQMAQDANLSRSELLRRAMAHGGIVYVGNDLVDALAECRKELAQVGNLMKLLAGQLDSLLANPLIAGEERTVTEDILKELQSAQEANKRTRLRLIKTAEDVHDRLREVGNGDF